MQRRSSLLVACTTTERGVRHDMLVATEWYRKAAVQGHVDAQYRLGLVCQYGHRRLLDTIAESRMGRVEKGEQTLNPCGE
jgi:TPR repeat protein